MRILFLLGLLIVFCSPVLATDAVNKGYTIALEADRRASGFGDYRADMQMVLRNRKKEESLRTMRSMVLEVAGDGDKSLTIFDSPGDVRGTALLTVSHKLDEDDQWLYLPAMKRVKRISSANKSGSFMGSEFAYEDLGSREIEKYDYRYVTDGEVEGRRCFVIELSPKKKADSGYSRILSWLDQDEYRIWQEEYYDQRNRLLKTLKVHDYHRYLGSFWRGHQLTMINHQNGRETDIHFANFEFGIGLTSRDFSKNSLKRQR